MDGPGDKATEKQRLGPGGALGWIFVFGMLAVGVLVGAVAYRLIAPEPEAVPSVERTPDVVQSVQDLARLETARMHMERIVDLRDQQSAFFGLVTAEDAILLVAAADVTAGVDLSTLGPDDVDIDLETRSVTVRLPPPEVFDARLDNEHTYVHTRDTDALAHRSAELETRARREAERSLRTAALQAGLLDRASTNAIRTVESLVRALGYQHVDVQIHTPAAIEAAP